MGKISKALEKSKKEQEQLQKDPFRSFKNHRRDKSRPADKFDKDRNRSDSQPAPNAKLGTIHTLLDDSVRNETAERYAASSKEKLQDPEEIKPVRKNTTPETSDEIKQEREINDNSSVKKRGEPPRPSKDERGSRRRPIELFDKDITGLDFQPTPISKQDTIRALLDNSTKMETIESYAKPSKEKVQVAEKVRLGRKDPTLESSDDTK